MIRTPASPQDEPPTLNTDDGSGDITNLRTPDIDEVDGDEVVFMAIMSPAKTIGNTNPEFHRVSYRVSLLLLVYNGDRITAVIKASAMATGLCVDIWLAFV